MNRFLAHLVERATRRGLLLERRQTSLFEPRAGRVGAPPDSHGAAVVVAEESDRAPAHRAAPAAANEPPAYERRAAGDSLVAVDPSPRSRPAIAPTASAAVSAPRGLAPRATRSHPAPEARSPMPRAADLQRAVKIAARTDDRTVPHIADAFTSPVLATPLRAEADHPTPSVPALGRAAHSALHPPALGATPRGTPPLRTVPAEAPLLHQAVRLAQAAAPRTEATRGSSGEKAVQITIGRVEVRAVGGAERSAGRPARVTPARLSLDDYLRRRNREAQ